MSSIERASHGAKLWRPGSWQWIPHNVYSVLYHLVISHPASLQHRLHRGSGKKCPGTRGTKGSAVLFCPDYNFNT